MHILDLVENSITVQSAGVKIIIVEDSCRDILSVEIKDDGSGMDRETIDKALDPLSASCILAFTVSFHSPGLKRIQ